mmetsp:Transcript_150984/g.263848  ORF Transcript_150984/g.263848 Transcript_150984/m.263848 type:complete len:112 (-) Transcript_150984:72-407(-)
MFTYVLILLILASCTFLHENLWSKLLAVQCGSSNNGNYSFPSILIPNTPKLMLKLFLHVLILLDWTQRQKSSDIWLLGCAVVTLEPQTSALDIVGLGSTQIITLLGQGGVG